MTMITLPVQNVTTTPGNIGASVDGGDRRTVPQITLDVTGVQGDTLKIQGSMDDIVYNDIKFNSIAVTWTYGQSQWTFESGARYFRTVRTGIGNAGAPGMTVTLSFPSVSAGATAVSPVTPPVTNIAGSPGNVGGSVDAGAARTSIYVTMQVSGIQGDRFTLQGSADNTHFNDIRINPAGDTIWQYGLPECTFRSADRYFRTVRLGIGDAGAPNMTVNLGFLGADSGAGGTFLHQGGDAFGAPYTAGSTDNQDVRLIRNGVQFFRAESDDVRIDAVAAVLFNAGSGISGTSDQSVAFAAVNQDVSLQSFLRDVLFTAGRNINATAASAFVGVGGSVSLSANVSDFVASAAQDVNLTAVRYVTITADGTITISSNAGDLVMGAPSGIVSLNGGTVSIQATSIQFNIGGTIYQWPTTDGSAGQQLTTNGAGVLTWT